MIIGSEVTEAIGVHPERMELWTQLYAEFHIERNSASTAIPYQSAIVAFTLYIMYKFK